MNSELIWEMIGYLGSALVLVSLLMSSVVKLRIINTIGSAIFTVYALVIHSYPTAIMNAALIVINIYFLVKIAKNKKAYSLVEIATDDNSLKYFCEKNGEDIKTYFPDFSMDQIDADSKIFMAYQDMTVAELFVAKNCDKELTVSLDYSTPQYRDCSVGGFVYDTLKDLGYNRIKYCGNNETHVNYVQKMGFAQVDGAYVKEL